MPKRVLADYDVKVHHETAKAYLVSTDDNEKKAVWIPKSQCEFVPKTQFSKIGVLTLPEEVAFEKGLA